MTDTRLPWTPDFDVYPTDPALRTAEIADTAVALTWADGRTSLHHAHWLRENSPDPETVHPLSREMAISPLDLPDDLHPQSVAVEDGGALRVAWSHGGHVSRYHPGWLRAHAWFDEAEPEPSPVLWSAAELSRPPTCDGPRALSENAVFLDWLLALRDSGIARLEGLACEDGLLERLVTRVGPIRETNFGRTYTLFIKDDPDSNAFTAAGLALHMDLPTRECPHGLQFFYCRENTTTGGEGLFVDGYRIAEDLRAEERAHFDALSGVVWEFNNRAKDCDYRARGPVVALDDAGRVSGIRLTPWLRAPLKAPLAEQERAYRSVRAFMRRSQDPAYQMLLRYRPGDLVAFDNRRVLHGRRAYDAQGGRRHIEGAYADRDDLQSRIRTLGRDLRAAKDAP